MKREHLIKMANQIGGFFEVMPDRQQAVTDIASHLRQTWDPRMRTQLLASLGGADEVKLKPIVVDALLALRQSDAI